MGAKAGAPTFGIHGGLVRVWGAVFRRLGGEVGQQVPEDLPVQPLLAFEVVGDEGGVLPGHGRHQADGGGLVAVLGKAGQGRLEKGVAGVAGKGRGGWVQGLDGNMVD